MRKTKSLSINIAANVIDQVSATLFPLITFPYVSRVLRPEGLGRVNFAEAVLYYFVMLATLGIPLYGVRESARRRDDRIALSTLALELFSLNTVMVAIAFGAFGAFMMCSHRASSDPVLFWVCALPMLLTPIGFSWLFNGLEEYVYITVRTLAIRVLVLIAIFLFVRTQEDYRIYALIGALNSMGVSLLNLCFVRKHISVHRVDWKKLNVWRHVKPVVLVFSLTGVVSIYTSLNKVMLGYMVGDTQVGLYSAADRVVSVVVTFVTSMGIVVLPRVSYYVEFERFEEYRRLASTILRFIAFLSFPAAAGVIVLASPLMPLLSGRAFQPAVPLVQIMGLSVILKALSQFTGYQVLYSQGRERLLLYSAVLGAVTNLGLNWLLIPRWYAIGAALSMLATETCVTGAQIVMSRAYSNFSWPIWGMLKYGTVAVSMAILVLSLGSCVSGAAPRVLISVAAGASFYVMMMWLLKDSMLSAIYSRLVAGVIAVKKAAGTGI